MQIHHVYTHMITDTVSAIKRGVLHLGPITGTESPFSIF